MSDTENQSTGTVPPWSNEQIAKWVGCVTALVAVISLAISIYQIRAEFQQQLILSWQKVAVYSIIRDAKQPDGLTFAEIGDKYSTRALVKEGFQIPKSELQPAALERILLDLLATFVIVYRDDSKYSVMSQPSYLSDPQVRETWKRDVELQKYTRQLVAFVQAEDGKYTFEQLAAKIQSQFGISGDEATVMISGLFAQRYVRIDEAGKVRTAFQPKENDNN